MAAPVTKWSVQIERADEIAPILRRAFKVATDAPQGPVFVALPIDVLEQETAVEAVAAGQAVARRASRSERASRRSPSLLLKSQKPDIVVGDDVARARRHRRAGGAGGDDRRLRVVRRACGATRRFRPVIPTTARSLPGDAAQVRKALGDTDLVLLLGGPFFEDIWFAPGGHFPKARRGGADRGLAPSGSPSTIGSMPASSATWRRASPR